MESPHHSIMLPPLLQFARVLFFFLDTILALTLELGIMSSLQQLHRFRIFLAGTTVIPDELLTMTNHVIESQLCG